MLEQITCDTDISELISEKDISLYLDNLDNIGRNYNSTICTLFDNEMTTGGLSANAYSIDNSSPLQERATILVDNLDIIDEVSNFKDEIISLLNEQRIKEINKLKDKVLEKIDSLQNEIDSLQFYIDSSNKTNFYDYISKKRALSEELSRYNDKYNSLGGIS